MLTQEAFEEWEKWKEWIASENNMFDPNFEPTEDTPQGAIDFYNRVVGNIYETYGKDIELHF